ncbi:Sel1 repeat-containing protein [Zavarzinia compransoris]|nr:Sel1 repeat-containing protein [Zavarzinia compransoris]
MSVLSKRWVRGAGIAAWALVLGLSGPALADREAGQKAMAAGDYATALAELKPLAEAGDAASQFDIGALYDNGLGVIADAVEAARWYQRAARQGDQSAMFNLGVMHEDGIGVARDPVQAYVYFSLSVTQGPPYAARNRDKVKASLTPDQLARGDELVRSYKPVPEIKP